MKKFIPISKPTITQKEIDYVNDAVRSGWVSSLGEYINKFEENFAKFTGSKYALATSSGTTALHLALVSYGIGEGDEVIIPDLTFVATANAVRYTRATEIIVDIDEDTLCISPQKIIDSITKKTKAIVPVHLYGHPANMSEINKIADKHDLLVLEDAAESHGAEIKGKRVGSFGDCGVFSFYGNKIITTGEGGMIVTNDRKFYEKAKGLRDHAMSNIKRYWHYDVGYNYRMTNLQAALGVAQLERIDAILKRKKEIFEEYNRILPDNGKIRLNCQADWAKNVFWMICLEVYGYTEGQRNLLMEELKKRQIDSRPYFYPISDLPMYKDGLRKKTPIAHKISQRGINLPSYIDMKNEDIAYICENIINTLRLH